MSKILRIPTRAEGGITPEEKIRLDEITKKWTKIAFRTEPIDREKITDAIIRLYASAGLAKPRVVIVPSPFVGRLASGIAAAIWHLRAATRAATDVATRAATYAATDVATRAATDVATRAATYAATYAATDAATRAATDDATYAATRAATDDATYAATDVATRAATDDATYAATDVATRAATSENWLINLVKQFTPSQVEFTIGCIKLSWRFYQGGNMWAYFGAYAEGMRDVIGLTGLPCWDKYQAWEDAAKEGGFRYMHKEFCIVSDFPEVLKVNIQNQPHCDNGPSHRWRDGFEIYHLNGVRFPKDLFNEVTSGTMPFEKILAIEDIDQRTQAMRYGNVWEFVKYAKAEKLDEYTKFRQDGTEVHYWLYKFPRGDIFTEDAYYAIYDDLVPGSTKQYMSGTEPFKTVAEAMAWKQSDDLYTVTPEEWKQLVPGVDMN